MRAKLHITHHGTHIEPGDIFIHEGSPVRLVFADPMQVTLRTNPLAEHEDNSYLQIDPNMARSQFGIHIRVLGE